MPQAQPWQQLTLQDSQMLQHQFMLKQMQELQKHRQFPEFADGRQQNYLNQQSELLMSANMSFMQHDASEAFRGFPSGTSPPIGSSIHHYNQHSHVQGISPDAAMAFSMVSNNQEEKSALQSSYGKPFVGENQEISPDLHSFTDGVFHSKQFKNGDNLFGQVRNEGFQQMNSLQMNASAEEFNSRQQQVGSSTQFQGKATKIDASQGAATLDPLEQKILFNMDGNGWNSSFLRDMEGHNNTLECSDYLSLFPSIQSGSWSALMQTAVAESSSENGVVPEEWSGLSFQNTKLSMDNQPSNNADVGNQQSSWVDNNAASSLRGKHQAPFGVTNMSPGFGFQFPNQQREGTRSNSSYESMQQSPKVGAKWLDGNCQQGQPVRGSQSNHLIQSPSGNAFPFQGFSLSVGNAEQRNIFAKSHDQTSIPTSFGPSMEPRVQQGNDNVTSVTDSVYTRSQHQKLYQTAAAVKAQSPQATTPNMANKLPPYDLFIPRGPSQSKFSQNPAGQQFPILEAVPVESSDLANTKLQAPPWVAQDPYGQKFSVGSSPQDPGGGLTNSQGFFSAEEHHEKTTAHPRALSEVVGQSTPPMGLQHGSESVAKHLSEENGVSSGTLMGHPHQVNFDGVHDGEKQGPSVSARDVKAFGRSLKPSNLHPNYSSSSEIKQEMGSVSGSSTSIFVNPCVFRDANMQSIQPSSLSIMQNNAEEMGSRGPSFSHTDINANDVASQKNGHSQVNMQMASGFNQYGPLRNEQMLSMYDRTGKNSMHPSPLGEQILEMKTPLVPLNVTGDNQDGVKLSRPCTSHPDIVDTGLSMTRSRKRKTATSDLLPWHTEVTQNSKRFQSISMAEIEWAKAGNRPVDKVDNEVNVIEDKHPLFRPKKRIILTTQLMQQIFMPAPAAILRANATLVYDSAAYFSAKLALGDACHLNSWSRNVSCLSCTNDNLMTEEVKASERDTGKHFSTIAENYTSRAKKLEADLLRLDQTTSLVDVIVEYKELEKISIINRFAKFHVRRQQITAETSTASGLTSLPKPAPQRYVVAFRGRALPENSQCFRL